MGGAHSLATVLRRRSRVVFQRGLQFQHSSTSLDAGA